MPFPRNLYADKALGWCSSLNEAALCRAGSPHIPPDSGSSPLITVLTCHSAPLSIIRSAKHRIPPASWRSAVTTSKTDSRWTFLQRLRKTFQKGMEKKVHFCLWKRTRPQPSFLIGLGFGFCLLIHTPQQIFGFLFRFYEGNTSFTSDLKVRFSLCNYSGVTSGTSCSSGRLRRAKHQCSLKSESNLWSNGSLHPNAPSVHTLR